MRKIITAVLFAAVLVAGSQPPHQQPAPHSKGTYAEDLSNLLVQVADPENTEFASFQKHFAKVIDVLDPKTDSQKIVKRVDKLVTDLHSGSAAYRRRRTERSNRRRSLPQSEPTQACHSGEPRTPHAGPSKEHIPKQPNTRP